MKYRPSDSELLGTSERCVCGNTPTRYVEEVLDLGFTFAQWWYHGDEKHSAFYTMEGRDGWRKVDYHEWKTIGVAFGRPSP